MLKDLAFSAVLPAAAYLLLTQWGVAVVPALVAGAVFPAAYTLYGAVRERRVQAMAVIVLAATAASAIGALFFTSPTLALAKGSLITGLVGAAFALSLLGRRPLAFHLALTGRDAAARAAADARWESQPEFRRTLRRITTAWALALPTEAALRLALMPPRLPGRAWQ